MIEIIHFILNNLRFIRIPIWKPNNIKLKKKLTDDKITKSWYPQYGIAVNDDPQLVISTRTWLPGWYMIEVTIESNQSNSISEIYFDRGHGFNNNEQIQFRINGSTTIKYILFLTRRLRRIRLDPISESGTFILHDCRIVWLTPKFATSRMIRRVSMKHQDYKGEEVSQILYLLKHTAKKRDLNWQDLLYSAYNDTFSINIGYESWWRANLRQRKKEINQLLSNFGTWIHKPRISILLPVYNTNPKWLEKCINSVRAQIYPIWQLCIADDASDSLETIKLLKKYENSDPRINIIWRPNNGHISQATNSALQVADGEYIALLDHDDLLENDALLYAVSEINKNPNILLIYSDEDKVNTKEEYYDPHFKSDWNPDLLLSHNYISHLGIYKAARIRTIGGFREGFEGSQDHDLVLRFTKGISKNKIAHIPRILYHWRATVGSTALSSKEKNYTAQSGLRAVRDFVKDFQPSAYVCLGMAPNSYRVQWIIPKHKPMVTILIPTRDRVDLLKPCLDSLLTRTNYKNIEVLILSNQTTCPETLSYFEAIKKSDMRVRVLEWNRPFNYSAINNYGAQIARGDIICLLNNDIEPINPEWLDELVSQCSRPEIACVGAKLYYPNGLIQHGGVILGIGGVAGHSHKYFDRRSPGYFWRLKLVQNVSAVTGACLVIRKEIYKKLGGLNEKDLKIAFNDVDLCLKAIKFGYRNIWTPYAELYHHESLSRGPEDTPQKRERFASEVLYMKDTWGDILKHDPFYNPNLTLEKEDFSLTSTTSP